MSNTYSVIIQNKKTMERFFKFHSLFMEAIDNSRIGICRWNEAGTSPAAALPELGELVNDKPAWRAIVVRYEDEAPMAPYPGDPRNPFDFGDPPATFPESPVPLVRLTHMLGGLPAPEISFVRETILEPEKPPRAVYRPVADPERDRAYALAAKKYAFDGTPPSTIVLITLRNRPDKAADVWRTRRESDSSAFWKRNGYPSICRFLVCDFAREGPVRRNADELRFWLGVLLLALNDPDPGALQAYRLYTLGVDLDPVRMGETFVRVAERLNFTRDTLEQELKKDEEAVLTPEEHLPDYKMDITVPLPPQEKEDLSLRPFPVLSQGPTTDLSTWARHRDKTQTALAQAIRFADRALDQAADRMKDQWVYPEEKVLGLDAYQTEDLLRQTGELYERIVHLQGELPSEDLDPELDQAAEELEKHLRGRLTGRAAGAFFGGTLALLTAGQIPGLVALAMQGGDSLAALLLGLLGEGLLAFLFGAVTVFLQNRRCRRLVETYNKRLKAAFGRLTQNAGAYSRYLSDIASHSRGKSYLAQSRRKRRREDSIYYARHTHLKAIRQYLARLNTWATAFHLKVDLTGVDKKAPPVNILLRPNQNEAYTFETGNSYPVEVNRSGMTVQSPFGFVERLTLEREELYDD